MNRFKLSPAFILVFIFLSFTGVALAEPEKTSRRDIDVVFDYEKVDDGFGNIRKILIDGTVQNNSQRIASKITVSFKLNWKNRITDSRKLEFANLTIGEKQSFQFDVELGAQPDALKSISVNIDQIKFTNTREASQPTANNLVVHELYSLARLNEEGKSFSGILKRLQTIHPFQMPVKDEFETTSEFETRVNHAEDVHFAFLMDELEKQYGQMLGGEKAVIRFLPRTFKKRVIYLSECSAYFQVPVSLGRYNADLRRFESIGMNPRTFPFPLQTYVPEADLPFMHKAGMFFLRKTDFYIQREEAKIWREQGKFLILEATIRFGVIQDGPYFQDFCVIEKVILKNADSGLLYREWLITP